MPLTLRLRSSRADSPEIAEAALAVRAGSIVVFPTETVYGIGVGLNFPEAAARVSELKQRPPGTWFMVHCTGTTELAELVRAIPASAFPLLERFLPGPLAIVLAASDRVPVELRGPGNTIGIRVTSHPVAQALIRRAGMPLIGTSANLHSAAATAEFSELDPAITAGADLVLDAGRCGTGVASTVVDLTVQPHRVLREGALSRAQLEAATGVAWTDSSGS